MRSASCGGVRRALGLAKDTRIWLHPGAFDDAIQWVWDNRDVAGEAIAANKFELVMSPDYSAWGVECPLTWAINAKRSLVTAARFSRVCRKSVVTLTVPNEYFAERWIAWLKEHDQVNCVAVNAQLWRGWEEFSTMLALTGRVARGVPRDVHFIVCGPTTAERMAFVAGTLPSHTIVSSDWFNRQRQSSTPRQRRSVATNRAWSREQPAEAEAQVAACPRQLALLQIMLPYGHNRPARNAQLPCDGLVPSAVTGYLWEPVLGA